MKIAWFYFNPQKRRWCSPDTETEEQASICFVLPEGTSFRTEFESRFCKGCPVYPVYEGKRLQRNRDVRR